MLQDLRNRVDALNVQILELLQERAKVVLEISRTKCVQGIPAHDPEREEDMIAKLTARSSGPFGSAEIVHVFRAIFQASLAMQGRKEKEELLVRKRDLLPDGGVRVGDVVIGQGRPLLIAGPCSVESAAQMEEATAALARIPGVRILRGGAYKPRTNPYAFQGLGAPGLVLLAEAGRRHGLPVVTEVLDAASVGTVAAHADMLQVGARNMFNTELLKALGRCGKPVLLKRGFMATIEELVFAAEYVVSSGNPNVVLCERGIRTFERATRNTLDISAIPLLKKETVLPVIVDLSHALGRRDIMVPCARAALAAGADGLMLEVHPRPEQALSDSAQQLDLEAFARFVDDIGLGGAKKPLAQREAGA